MFENLLKFANQIKIGMETITLSFDPNSEFAAALDELIRNSEDVRVEKRSVDTKAVMRKIQDLFVDDKGWDSEEEMLEDLARFRQERIAKCVF